MTAETSVSVAISLSNNSITSNLDRLKYLPQVFATSFSAFVAVSLIKDHVCVTSQAL